jgi:hypothetical protein
VKGSMPRKTTAGAAHYRVYDRSSSTAQTAHPGRAPQASRPVGGCRRRRPTSNALQENNVETETARDSQVLTVAEVAARLRCSKAHVCNAINGRVNGVTALPSISMGRRKLVRCESLAAWLEQNEGTISTGIDAVGASKG